MPPTEDAQKGNDMADNKALAQRFNDEVLNQGNFDALDEIVADDFVEHQELPPGIPPTGKKVSMAMFDRVVVRDGKAAEHWGLSDDMGMMTQLGVVPEMG